MTRPEAQPGFLGWPRAVNGATPALVQSTSATLSPNVHGGASLPAGAHQVKSATQAGAGINALNPSPATSTQDSAYPSSQPLSHVSARPQTLLQHDARSLGNTNPQHESGLGFESSASREEPPPANIQGDSRPGRFSSPSARHREAIPMYVEDVARLDFSLKQARPEVTREAVRNNWDKCLVGTDYHLAFAVSVSTFPSQSGCSWCLTRLSATLSC
jgi:hypothetical protein